MKIPGVFLCLLFSQFLYAECGLPEPQLYTVAHVIDGDTLRLSDGVSVRVLGVNAPEVSHRGKSGQPLGTNARAAANTFVAASKQQVRLGFESEKRDRYGRLLAHVYNRNGQSLAAYLLRDGMALHIAVPPNLNQSTCLRQFEQHAREWRTGVWLHPYWQVRPVVSLDKNDQGFMRVRGKVKQVTINKAVWLELDGNLVARVAKADLRYFTQAGIHNWQALEGKTVELRGWVTARKSSRNTPQPQPLLLSLRSPAALEVIAP